MKKIKNQRTIVREFKLTVRRRSSIPDIGTGRGELLDVLRQRELSTLRIRNSHDMTAYTWATYGSSELKESIEVMQHEPGAPIDAIALSAVLEHVHHQMR